MRYTKQIRRIMGRKTIEKKKSSGRRERTERTQKTCRLIIATTSLHFCFYVMFSPLFSTSISLNHPRSIQCLIQYTDAVQYSDCCPSQYTYLLIKAASAQTSKLDLQGRLPGRVSRLAGGSFLTTVASGPSWGCPIQVAGFLTTCRHAGPRLLLSLGGNRC